MKGNLLAEQAFHEGALFFANDPVLRLEDKLATTRLTLMVLLPSLQMTIALESLGTTGWTCFSYDQGSAASLICAGVSANNSIGS